MAVASAVVECTDTVYVLAAAAPVKALEMRDGQQVRVVIAAALPAVDADTYFTLKRSDGLMLLPALVAENVYVRAEFTRSKVSVLFG